MRFQDEIPRNAPGFVAVDSRWKSGVYEECVLINPINPQGRGGILNSFFFPEDLKMFPEPIYGIIDKAIVQGRVWRVKFNGSYWFARLYYPNRQTVLEPGQIVRVLGIQGITLLVTAVDQTGRE